MMSVNSQPNLFSLPEANPNWQLPELPELTGVESLSLDTETTGKNPFKDKPIGISIAYRAPELRSVYLPFGHASGNLDFELVRHWANTELFAKKIHFANAKFDIHMLNNVGIDLEAIGVQPTDIAFNGALLDDNRISGFGLDDLAMKYLGERKLDVKGGKKNLQETPAWFLADYAKKDAELTYLIEEYTQPLIRQDGLENVIQLENDIIYCVCEIERNGCRLDMNKVDQWVEEIRAELDQALLDIYTLTGIRLNPNSGEELHKFFKQMNIPSPGYRGKKGWAGFTEERLKLIQHPVMERILFARHADFVLSNFLEKYQAGAEGDLIRFQLHQLKGDQKLGAVSGRFSSSGSSKNVSGYGFNVQQVIKTEKQIEELGDRWLVRELMIPDEGYTFFAADAAQIEYRLVAHYAENEKVLGAYNAKEPYEFKEIDGKKVYTSGPDSDYHAVVMELLRPRVPGWLHEPAKKIRKPVKNVNFARLYGGGPPKISYMLKLDGSLAGIPKLKREEYREKLPETMAFLDIYDQILPEARDLMSLTINLARSRGWVKTMMGRRARFEPDDRHYSALNRIIQGTAADIMKLKMKNLYHERHNLGIHKLRQVVHDEQCGDLDPDPLVALRLQEFFNEQDMDLKVPILWDLSLGKNWRDCD